MRKTSKKDTCRASSTNIRGSSQEGYTNCAIIAEDAIQVIDVDRGE